MLRARLRDGEQGVRAMLDAIGAAEKVDIGEVREMPRAPLPSFPPAAPPTTPSAGPPDDGPDGPDGEGQAEGPEGGPSLPQIIISTSLQEMNNEAIKALAACPDLYQNNRRLVRVLRPSAPRHTQHLKIPANSPHIAEMEAHTLQEIMSATARWATVSAQNKVKSVSPPFTSAQAILKRGDWDGIRHLAGIVESPSLRPDGTVHSTPGYDEATGLLYLPDGEFPEVPAEPKPEDATAAAARLLDLVVDFPFVDDAHRAGWLAALLTVLAKPAIAGPCPLFLFEASRAGSGKSLLAEIIGIITTGRELAVSELSTDAEEVRKALTAILLEGERLVLLDNASGTFGCAPLDAVLTGTTYKGRILGETKRTPEMPVNTVFFATGNNLTLRGDTHRRVIPCRVEPQCENPEERTGFRHPDLKQHVRDNRRILVVDALTILRASALHRQPAELTPFGSYASWSQVVQQAVYFATGEDPCRSRAAIAPESRGERGNLTAIFQGWALLPGGLLRDGADPANFGLTARQALDYLRRPFPNDHDPYADLKEALGDLAEKDSPLPDVNKMGYFLRASNGKVAGNLQLHRNKAANDNKPARWFVTPVSVSGPTPQGGMGDAGGCLRRQPGPRATDNPAQKLEG